MNLGRTKGKHLHTAAKALVKKYPQAFSDAFEQTKKRLAEMGVLKQTKGERNKLAGQIAKDIKKANKKEAPVAP